MVISRRNFVKLAGIIALGVAVVDFGILLGYEQNVEWGFGIGAGCWQQQYEQ